MQYAFPSLFMQYASVRQHPLTETNTTLLLQRVHYTFFWSFNIKTLWDSYLLLVATPRSYLLPPSSPCSTENG